MASISKIGKSWRALIRRAGHKAICKTFPTRTEAVQWARRIETSIDSGSTPESAYVRVSDVLAHYRKLRANVRPIAPDSNKHYMLRHLEEGLGGLDATKLTTDDLLGWCRMRIDEGAGPYTVNMEISTLGTALRYGGAALGLELHDVVARARPALTHFGLIGAGHSRERRCAEDELQAVLGLLAQPYRDAVELLVLSTLRRGELCRMAWADVDQESQCVLIRDRKHPRKKKGNDELVPFTDRAWQVLMRQPQTAERVFPIKANTLSTYFTNATRKAGIPNLHLHDLRHEGTTRLFEEGYQIQEVALFTGHKDWRNLRRYTQLDPKKFKR